MAILESFCRPDHGMVAAGQAVTLVAQRGESGGGLMRRVPVVRWVAIEGNRAVGERPV